MAKTVSTRCGTRTLCDEIPLLFPSNLGEYVLLFVTLYFDSFHNENLKGNNGLETIMLLSC